MEPEALRARLARVPDRRAGVPVNTDPDRSGQAGALTVLTPIEPGEQDDLRGYLEGLRRDRQPAGAPAAHALRPLGDRRGLRVRRRARARPPRARPTCCSPRASTARSTATSTSCATSSRAEAPAIWGRCAGAPQPPAGAALKAYLRAHQATTGFFVAAYPQATVGQVRDALAQREDVIAFARSAQAMDPAQLQAAFHERARRVTDGRPRHRPRRPAGRHRARVRQRLRAHDLRLLRHRRRAERAGVAAAAAARA